MRDNSLNILLIASWYPSKENPTAGSFVQEQAHMLRDFGHQVTVIHPFMLGTFVNAFKKRSYNSFSEEYGIRVLRVGVAPPLPFFRGISYAYCFQRVRNAMKNYGLRMQEFTIIHSHAAFMGGYIAMKFSQYHGIPFLHTEHASGLHFNPKQYTSTDMRVLHKIYSNARNVLFVSRYSLSSTLKNLKLADSVRYDLLPNAIDNSFFEEPIIRDSVPTNFLMVGDFLPVKNHELLFQAWIIVQDKYPVVNLTIIGDGIDKIELIKRFPSLNLDTVTVLPRLNRAKLRKVMSTHEVILSSSIVETFGLSIAEAQALGIPAVVTNSGGVRDIITLETGIITEPSASAYAEGILQMIQSYHAYDSIRIRQLASQRFASEVIMNQLNSIYQQVL
ncbi:MAG: glycosyltransferase [Flavobacteriales bacterium]|jgi:glycosyltransferase involved in cell wall biosynthesis